MSRKNIVITVAVIIAGIGYYFIGGDAGKKSNQKITAVTTAVVDTSVLEDEINTIGSLEADAMASLRPEVSGQVKAIRFTEGQAVQKGDVLLEIDDAIYKATEEQAKAAYDIASVTYKRRLELKKTGATSIQSSDEAEATMRQAKASYDLARIKLDKTTIRAPFSGIVSMLRVNEGDFVDGGSIITQMVAIDPIKIKFSLPEKHIAQIAVNSKLYVTVDAFPKTVFEGSLYAIDPIIDTDTRNITAKGKIPNADAKLKTGMFANVHLKLEQRNDVVMIPEEAVIPKGGANFVFKADGDTAHLVKVDLGERRQGKIEVTSGLLKGDVIIVAGGDKIQDGGSIKPSVLDK